MTFDLVSVGVTTADVMVRPVDAFPQRGQLQFVPQLEAHLGGLAAVTAAVFCALGGRAALIARLGRDRFGDLAAASLAETGVDITHVQRSEDSPTSATVALIHSDGERSFLHQVGATAQISEADIDRDLVSMTRIFHWGGAGLTPGLNGLPMARIMNAFQEKGVITSLDTAFDASGVWLPHIEPALAYVDIVMASKEEAMHHSGATRPEAMAAFFQGFGARAVMIKMGDQGLYVSNGREAHHVPPHAVKAVDSTGAGDAACAGFLYGYLHEWDLLRCGRLAGAAGALTVQHVGGFGAIKSLRDVLTLAEEN